ncbi:MAG: hypothetical protein ACI81T_003251 [Bacteroidia bacterium]|jgi:hypothetical protein
MKNIKLQKVRTGSGWQVTRHDFFAIAPENALPIVKVQDYFTENLFQATNGNFTVDLGFYGTYHQNRDGNFVIYLIKGDFYTGELLEKVTTRSKEEAVLFLEQYMKNVNKGVYFKKEGLGFGDLIYKFKNLSVSRSIFNLF